MTVQQIVRDLLERAIEDGLASPATDDLRDEPDPQQFTAEDLVGCTGLLAAFLRRHGAHAAAPEAGA
jgi:hypothetical protein